MNRFIESSQTKQEEVDIRILVPFVASIRRDGNHGNSALTTAAGIRHLELAEE